MRLTRLLNPGEDLIGLLFRLEDEALAARTFAASKRYKHGFIDGIRQSADDTLGWIVKTRQAIESSDASAAAYGMAQVADALIRMEYAANDKFLRAGVRFIRGQHRGGHAPKRYEGIYVAVCDLVADTPKITAKEAWGSFVEQDVPVEVNGRWFNIFRDDSIECEWLTQEELNKKGKRIGSISKIKFDTFRKNYLKPAKKNSGA